MLGSMDELSAHPPASFLYVSGSGVYSVRVRAVPSGDGAGNRMGSCRARVRGLYMELNANDEPRATSPNPETNSNLKPARGLSLTDNR